MSPRPLWLLVLLLCVTPLRAQQGEQKGAERDLLRLAPAHPQVLLITGESAGTSGSLPLLQTATDAMAGMIGQQHTDATVESVASWQGLDPERPTMHAWVNVLTGSSLRFVPITGSDEFVRNFEGDVILSERVTAVKSKQTRATVYVRLVGTYAVVSPDRGTLMRYRPGGEAGATALRARVGEVGSRVLDVPAEAAEANRWASAWLYVDARALEPLVRLGAQLAASRLRMQRAQWQEAGADEGWIATHEAASQAAVSAVDAAARHSDAWVLMQEADTEGSVWTLRVRPREASTLAATLDAFHENHGATPAPAPDGRAVGADGDPRQAKREGLLNRLPDGPWVAAWSVDGSVLHLLAGRKQVASLAGTWYVPRGRALLGGAVNTLNVIDLREAALSPLERARAMVRGWDGATVYVEPRDESEAAAGEPESARVKATLTPDAAELAGTSVDRYQLLLDAPPRLTLEGGPLAFVLVGAGVSGYLAQRDGLVLATTSQNEELMTSALRHLDGEGEPLARGELSALRKRAAAGRTLAEVYVDARGVVEVVEMYGPLLGTPGVGRITEPPEGARPPREVSSPLNGLRPANRSAPSWGEAGAVAVTAGVERDAMIIRVVVPARVQAVVSRAVKHWNDRAGRERPRWDIEEAEVGR